MENVPDIESIKDQIINEIAIIRENNGRLFFCGVGGSAGHASHAVNDFRFLKI
jgi:D-sedoheptulose 7-phosphate isomerase